MIALAEQRPTWAVGFEDECWWSRLAHPALHTWTAGNPLRLVAPVVANGGADPKALACYGLVVRPGTDAPEHIWLRFVDGRPLSAITTQFLDGCSERLAAMGITTLVLVWDNASWHVSGAVRTWLRAHNQRAHRDGGVRLVPCFLPTRSPWLNAIEPMWGHAKKRVVEPARLLPAHELEERVCAAFACPVTDHLAIPKEVA